MSSSNSIAVGDDANRCLIIRASAGTGKTFQLSNRYLTRLVDGIPPDRILATTFTRNAAAEILERVLKRLATGATNDTAATELAGEIGRPKLNRDECVRLLAELTRSLHRIRVSTLDAFFVKLAGNFAQELGLPAGWSILDEADERQLQQRAIERMLQQDSASLLRILNLMQKGETKRSVNRQVLTTVQDLYQHYRISDEEAWKAFPGLPQLSRQGIAQAVERLNSVQPDKPSMEDQKQRCLRNVALENWAGFVDGKFCENIENGTMSYSRSPIPEDLAAAVSPLIQHARVMMIQQWANQNIRTWELLNRFDNELNSLKHSRRMFQFDDMNHFLQPAHLAMIGPRVQYRMDGRVTNLLLDEFQDTSLSQWNAIRPFAKNSAQPDDPQKSFFCVGDVKQAITAGEAAMRQSSRPLNAVCRSTQVHWNAVIVRRRSSSIRSTRCSKGSSDTRGWGIRRQAAHNGWNDSSRTRRPVICRATRAWWLPRNRATAKKKRTRPSNSPLPKSPASDAERPVAVSVS